MAIQNLLFLAVLALIPIQLNKFFFIESSYVFGLPLDYKALSIYLSDIAIVGFIGVFVFNNRTNLKSIYQGDKGLILSLFAFNFFILANNLFREGFPVTSYFSLRILVGSLFFIAATQVVTLPKLQGPIFKILTFSLVWQSILIIFQFLNQRAQGFWFLGERSFDSGTVNIAHIDIFGQQLLRSYGTFPHPNITGAFLIITLILLSICKQPKDWDRANKLYQIAPILAPTAAILTFSRSALTVFALLILSLSKSVKNIILKALVALAVLAILTPLLINTQLASIAERLTLTQASLDIAAQNPVFGVGNTNFLTHLASLNLTSLAQTRLIQPVHNVFLLVLAENGLIGFSLFIIFLFFVSKNAKSKIKLLLFVSLLFFMTVDHFLWTIHQGQMLFWLSLSYLASKPENS